VEEHRGERGTEGPGQPVHGRVVPSDVLGHGGEHDPAADEEGELRAVPELLQLVVDACATGRGGGLVSISIFLGVIENSQ